MKHAYSFCVITLLLPSCSSLQHSDKKRIETTQIECAILAREKSLSDAIMRDDIDTYAEHLTHNQRAQAQGKDNLDLAIARLRNEKKPLTANTYDPRRSEVRLYYGTIKLRRHNTLAYVNYGFGTVGCLGCRALRVGDVTSIKSLWRLENDGQWRRDSNRAGPSVSVFEFKPNQTQCQNLQNQD